MGDAADRAAWLAASTPVRVRATVATPYLLPGDGVVEVERTWLVDDMIARGFLEVENG